MTHPPTADPTGDLSTDLTTDESYTTTVESVEGQDLIAKSFPAGASAPVDIIVPDPAQVPEVAEAVGGVDGVDAVSPPVAQGDRGVLIQATLEPEPSSHPHAPTKAPGA